MANQRSRGTFGALCMAIRQLVLHGLPMTSTPHVRCGARLDRFAGIGEDGPVDTDQIAPLHPFFARHAAHAQDKIAVAEAVFEMAAIGFHDSGQRREGAVVQLHHHTVQRRHDRRNFNQVQDDRLLWSEDLSRRQAENQRVANLAGGPVTAT